MVWTASYLLMGLLHFGSGLEFNTPSPSLSPVHNNIRLRPGRHVCTEQRDSSTATVKKFQAYHRPTYQSYAHRCQDKICRGVRVMYETAYRDVQQTEPLYQCCPGWTHESRDNLGCNVPVCRSSCLNSGTCSHPDTCICTAGFTGPQCETDIDECLTDHGCTHVCRNTVGSYKCSCRPGFRLAPDSRSCFRKGKNKTLDGKFDVEIFAKKLLRLEKMWKRSAKLELQTELSDSPSNDELQASLENLHKKLESMNHHQQERWKRIESEMERFQPVCRRLDSLERKLDLCNCNCKSLLFSRLHP